MSGRVYVVSEIRMHRDAAGRVRAKHPAGAYDNWTPFREVSGEVTVLARLDTSVSDESGVFVEGRGVSVRGLPYYVGAKGVIGGFWRVRESVRTLFRTDDLVVLRLPEITSIAVWSYAAGSRVVSMVVGDAAALAMINLPTFFRGAATVAQRVIARIVRRSDAVVYVSERSLQELYPPRAGVPTLARSNVRVPEGWMKGARSARDGDMFTIVTVGALAKPTKGIDVLIRAIAHLSSSEVKLVVIGEGQLKASYMDLARSLKVDADFLGQVDDRAVIARSFDQAALYVSASRTEGLSRAMVEAMARGLPIVTTDVGAARELVGDPEAIVAPDDARALARAIQRMITDEAAWAENSIRSVRRSAAIVAAADPRLLTRFLQAARGL